MKTSRVHELDPATEAFLDKVREFFHRPPNRRRSSRRRPSQLRRVLNNPNQKLRWLAGAFFLVALVFVIYLPILPGSFVMDDERLIKDANPLFTGELTTHSVWFQTDFPLTLSTWWLQWLMWGDSPGGYHVVNIALQAISAILLWRLLVHLKIPGAWLAAAIFAVHPVCVGSVARVAELKNTLSLPFFLLSFWGYLHYETSSLYRAHRQQGYGYTPKNLGTWWLILSFVAFVLALLSKTSTVMLPVALLVCAAWQRGRITQRDLIHTAPYFFTAFAFAWMSIWFQKYQALAGEIVARQSFWERLTTAAKDFWFYVGKALLPVNLTVFYSRWPTNISAPAAILPLVAIAGLVLVCWRFRRGWGKHALFGVGCFAVLLFPALGFFDAQCFTKFQVSDHLQYLPLIALVSLAAGALASRLNRTVFQYVAVALLLTLSLLAFRRAEMFANQELLLRDTIAKNPAAWPVHNDLGVLLANNGKFAEAEEHFKASLQSHPGDADTMANLALTYLVQGRAAAADTEYRDAIKIKPAAPKLYEGLAQALGQEGRDREAIEELKIALCFTSKSETRLNLAALLYKAREFHGSVDQYRQVLTAEPGNVTALNNLACVLTSCSDKTVRNSPEAIALAERACQITEFKQIPVISTLSAAYREGGRLSDAVAAANLASRLQLAVSEGAPTSDPLVGN